MRLARALLLALTLLAALAGPAAAVYEGFIIPSAAVAAFPAQSRVFSQDLQILADGARGNGIVHTAGACAVLQAASPDMTVRLTTGCTIVVNTATQAVTTGNFTIAAANATNPRFDIAGATSAGVKTTVTGTAAASPTPPTIPDNFIVFATIYVPANDTAIGTTQITDKRIFVQTPGVGSGAATTLSYITKVAEGTLSNEFAMGSLATGLVQNTVTTGVPTTIAPTDDNVVVGNGTTWQLKALPTCSGGSSALTYNISTNAFGCNTISGGGSTPTGTGFTHITAGAQDGAAKLVDTADINNSQVTLAKLANASAGTVMIGGSPPSFTATPNLTSLGATILQVAPQGAGAGQTGLIRFLELAATGTNLVSLQAPDAIAADFALTLPNALPGSTQAITVTSAGLMGYQAIAGGGDFSSNTSTSVDNEVVLFSGTGGKTGKRATGLTYGPTTGLLATSSTTGAMTAEVSDAATTGTVSGIKVKHTTSGAMADTFGVGVTFFVRDSSAVDNFIGGLIAERSGADDTGTLALGTAIAGSYASRLTINNTGAVTIPSLASAGTTMVTATAAGLLGTAAIPGGGGSSDIVAVVTSDVTKNNNTTLGDITGLSFSLGATEIWQIEVQLLMTAANITADWKLKWTGPVGFTMKWAPHNLQATGYFDPTTGTQIALLTEGTTAVYGSGAVTGGMLFRGWVFGGGTGGTVRLQFAQNVANATNSTINTGSVLFARKLAN